MNNVDFIKSIKIESDFEYVVKKIVSYIYDAEAYLTGGPYDGGRDLIYKRQGVEVREAVGITIQEERIEAKILSDAAKVKNLVDEHGYPNKFTFFWSKSLTASKKAAIRKQTREKTGIELEIYDANEIEQIITDDYPELLNYIIEEIHGYKKSNANELDIRAKTLFDYLALSGDAAELKASIIEAHVISSLLSSPKNKESLVKELISLGYKEGAATNRINFLEKRERIETTDSLLKLSSKERSRIDLVINKDKALRAQLVEILSSFTIQHLGVDLGEQALSLIQSVYQASNDIQLSEAEFDPPKVALAKEAFGKIEALVKKSKPMELVEARAIAKELIELTSSNGYFSSYCSSMLCIGLLNQKKLEKYIKDKSLFIYLDTPVLIRYLALFKFSDSAYRDRELEIVSRLKNSIKSSSEANILVTTEHFEETIRHITQAEKIFSFANDDLIAKFGDSKNVYFNIYLRAKKKRKTGYSFYDFLEELIGYDPGIQTENNFSAYQSCAARLLLLANITIQPSEHGIENDPRLLRVTRKYEEKISSQGKHRSRRAIINDIKACYVLGDTGRHIDKNGQGHTPILITWDGAYPALREIFCREYRGGEWSEWIVHSPFRALERLDMLDFKVSPDVVKDNVLAILDEDYIRESSLIDTLSIFLGDDRIETEQILALLSKLSGRTIMESTKPHEFEVETKNPLTEMLLAIYSEMRDSMSTVRKLFADPTQEAPLVEIIEKYLSGSDLKNLLDSIKRMANHNSTQNT